MSFTIHEQVNFHFQFNEIINQKDVTKCSTTKNDWKCIECHGNTHMVLISKKISVGKNEKWDWKYSEFNKKIGFIETFLTLQLRYLWSKFSWYISTA